MEVLSYITSGVFSFFTLQGTLLSWLFIPLSFAWRVSVLILTIIALPFRVAFNILQTVYGYAYYFFIAGSNSGLKFSNAVTTNVNGAFDYLIPVDKESSRFNTFIQNESLRSLVIFVIQQPLKLIKWCVKIITLIFTAAIKLIPYLFLLGILYITVWLLIGLPLVNVAGNPQESVETIELAFDGGKSFINFFLGLWNFLVLTASFVQPFYNLFINLIVRIIVNLIDYASQSFDKTPGPRVVVPGFQNTGFDTLTNRRVLQDVTQYPALDRGFYNGMFTLATVVYKVIEIFYTFIAIIIDLVVTIVGPYYIVFFQSLVKIFQFFFCAQYNVGCAFREIVGPLIDIFIRVFLGLLGSIVISFFHLDISSLTVGTALVCSSGDLGTNIPCNCGAANSLGFFTNLVSCGNQQVVYACKAETEPGTGRTIYVQSRTAAGETRIDYQGYAYCPNTGRNRLLLKKGSDDHDEDEDRETCLFHHHTKPEVEQHITGWHFMINRKEIKYLGECKGVSNNATSYTPHGRRLTQDIVHHRRHLGSFLDLYASKLREDDKRTLELQYQGVVDIPYIGPDDSGDGGEGGGRDMPSKPAKNNNNNKNIYDQIPTMPPHHSTITKQAFVEFITKIDQTTHATDNELGFECSKIDYKDISFTNILFWQLCLFSKFNYGREPPSSASQSQQTKSPFLPVTRNLLNLKPSELSDDYYESYSRVFFKYIQDNQNNHPEAYDRFRSNFIKVHRKKFPNTLLREDPPEFIQSLQLLTTHYSKKIVAGYHETTKLVQEQYHRRILQTADNAVNQQTQTQPINPILNNVNAGLLTGSSKGTCPYPCPDMKTCKTPQTAGDCPMPTKWSFSVIVRYIAFSITQATQLTDLRFVGQGILSCWLDIFKNPQKNPVTFSNLRSIVDIQENPPQKDVTYCFPMFPLPPLLPLIVYKLETLVQEKCGPTFVLGAAAIQRCNCPQYQPAVNLLSYNEYWMIWSPLFVQARLLDCYKIIQYWITRLPGIDLVNSIWTSILTFVYPNAPIDVVLIFDPLNADAGMGGDENLFCIFLNMGSVIYVAIFLVFPFYVFWQVLLPVIIIIVTDIRDYFLDNFIKSVLEKMAKDLEDYRERDSYILPEANHFTLDPIIEEDFVAYNNNRIEVKWLRWLTCDCFSCCFRGGEARAKIVNRFLKSSLLLHRLKRAKKRITAFLSPVATKVKFDLKEALLPSPLPTPEEITGGGPGYKLEDDFDPEKTFTNKLKTRRLQRSRAFTEAVAIQQPAAKEEDDDDEADDELD